MPDILKRFSTYKNTLTQHGAIALIGAGMVALGVDASYFFDVPFLQTVSKTAGAVACLGTLFSYKKGWEVAKSDLRRCHGWDIMLPDLKKSDEQQTSHQAAIKRRKEDVIENAVPYGLVSAAACLITGVAIQASSCNTQAPPP